MAAGMNGALILQRLAVLYKTSRSDACVSSIFRLRITSKPPSSTFHDYHDHTMAFYQNYSTAPTNFYGWGSYSSGQSATTPCLNQPSTSQVRPPRHVDLSLGYRNPPSSADQLEIKREMRYRLRRGLIKNWRGAFPFVCAAPRHLRTTRMGYEIEEPVDIVSSSGYAARYLVLISFSNSKIPNGPSSWKIHHDNADQNGCLSQQVPFAQVQLHPEVMNTRYARCIERDRNLISSALAMSIELGVLISITTQAALEGRPTLQDTIVYVATSVHGNSSVVYSTKC